MRLRSIVSALLIATPAYAGDTPPSTERFRSLGECLVFISLDAGLDGKKTVHPDTEATLRAIGGEYMFEASVLGFDDATTQNYVVEKLVEMNLQSNEQGIAGLKAMYGEKCKAVAISVVAPNQ